MVMVALVTSQAACAGKIHRINSPVDQAQLPQDYTYTVKLRTDEKISGLQTEDIQQRSNHLIIESNDKKRSLLDQEIEYIYGQSNQAVEYRRLESAMVGSGFGGALGFTVGYIMAILKTASEKTCEDNCSPRTSDKEKIVKILISTGVGGVLGGGIGFVASRKKKKEILITPTVNPTSQGKVDAGVNVGVKF